MSKFDKKLGLQVNEYLKSVSVETPYKDNGLSNEDKLSVISDNFKNIMCALGLDLTDDSLQDTPSRVAKMYVNEIFKGLDYSYFPKCTTVDNKMGYDEMVIEKDIVCISSCEHHFVTIDQKACVAYIPNKKVLGLSKLNRICKFFAQRPQIQERFTEQVFHTLSYILQTDDVAVMVSGRHFCVAQRGVEDSSSYTVTSKLGGRFKNDPDTRREFISLIG